MNRAVIVDGVRTPFMKAGSLTSLRATTLGCDVIEHLHLNLHGFRLEDIDLVIGANVGNQVLPPDGSNLTRLIALKAGIPIKVPAFTVNINCASGLHAILTAVKEVELGLANCVLVVAVEVMSDYTAAYSRKQRQKFANLLTASRSKSLLKKLSSTASALVKVKIMKHDPQWMIKLGLTDPSCNLSMDKVSDKIAEKYKISREELDLYALESHRRANNASDRLRGEMCSFTLNGKKELPWFYDDGVRPNQTLAALAKLKPLNEGGVTTAGNSSQITDGAVAFLIANKEWAAARKLPVLAAMSSKNSAACGCEPSMMGLGPVGAISKLRAQGWTKMSDFSVVETNEAFASVVLAQSKMLKEIGMGPLDWDRTNVNGGAIAIGHPISASGARLVLTCAKELQRRNQQYGLVTLCVGGGQGVAAVIENNE
ncbi:MAG: thiolase family protein [bacterium]|nr:thiolase family protein [bacterium]